MNVVDSTLSKLRKNAAKRHGTAPNTSSVRPSKRVPIPKKIVGRITATVASTNDKVQSIIKTMSAEKGEGGNTTLANTVPTLSEMATSTGPIMDNFDTVLVRCRPALCTHILFLRMLSDTQYYQEQLLYPC